MYRDGSLEGPPGGPAWSRHPRNPSRQRVSHSPLPPGSPSCFRLPSPAGETPAGPGDKEPERSGPPATGETGPLRTLRGGQPGGAGPRRPHVPGGGGCSQALQVFLPTETRREGRGSAAPGPASPAGGRAEEGARPRAGAGRAPPAPGRQRAALWPPPPQARGGAVRYRAPLTEMEAV